MARSECVIGGRWALGEKHALRIMHSPHNIPSLSVRTRLAKPSGITVTSVINLQNTKPPTSRLIRTSRKSSNYPLWVVAHTSTPTASATALVEKHQGAA